MDSLYTLENESLAVAVTAVGAELQSLVHKSRRRELLWQRDPAYWARSSPVLFPCIGELKNGGYNYRGNSYVLPKHGFARDRTFQLLSKNEQALSLGLSSDAATRSCYPFPFELRIHYMLDQSQLACTYEVYNPGTECLLFSIGGHPAFQLEQHEGQRWSDHTLHFEADQHLRRYFLQDGLLREDHERYALDNGRLTLSPTMFRQDAWVIKELQSTGVTLMGSDDVVQLHFDFEGFPYLGLWAPVGAPFLCIEPWCGLPDGISHNGNLDQKEGIQRLPSGALWQRTWRVTVPD